MEDFDRSKIDYDAEAVFDGSLKGKKIHDLDRAGLDFEDEGYKRVPKGRMNLMCKYQRIPSAKYKENYDKIRWDRC